MSLRVAHAVLLPALLFLASACLGGSSEEARLLDPVPEFLSAEPTVRPLPAPGGGFEVVYKGDDTGNPDLVMQQFSFGDIVDLPSGVEWEDVVSRTDRTSHAAKWECGGISFVVVLTWDGQPPASTLDQQRSEAAAALNELC